MGEAEKFSPEQIVSARDLQRSISGIIDRLGAHGSLLLLNHGKPVAVLTALDSTFKEADRD